MVDAVNPLTLSDEDFLKDYLPSGEMPAVEAPVVTDPAATEVATTEEVVVDAPVVEEDKTDAQVTAEAEVKSEPEKKEDEVVDPLVKAEIDKVVDPLSGSDKKEEPKTEEVVPNYENFYTQIMTPFKANGKMVQLRSPEEAIKLIQMGANYTKKVQELAPQKKILGMLENNGLLDEGKLSFLIDLDKKNPDAIRQLVKDSGIDPLEINVDDKTAYVPTNHGVTDAEVNFNTALEDIASTPEGVETLTVINTTWDKASKEALWEAPQLMETFKTQRENGIYDQITAEIDHLKLMKVLPADMPFIAAYKHAGDKLFAEKRFVTKEADKVVLGTRVATPKPVATNGDKAAAAAASKAAASKVTQTVNPLAMSDEDFLKSKPQGM